LARKQITNIMKCHSCSHHQPPTVTTGTTGFMFVLLTASFFVACATKKPVAVNSPVIIDTASTAVVRPLMENALDSFSYALGLSMAGFYKQQGIEDINTDLIIQALNDTRNDTARMDEEEVNNAIVSYMQQVKSERAAANKKEGQAFLDSNRLKPAVVTLASGLQYQVLKEGNGPKPGPTDKVKVHYEGTLLDGTIFDSSVKRGEPIELNVNGVIPGWTEALVLMPVGSKWRLFIPSDLAYGDNQAGPDIKPGSTLLFDVELLEIVK